MNENIQQALESLADANIAGYFEQLEQVEIPLSLKATYTGLKSTFIQGLKTADFDQRLALFARDVEKAQEKSDTKPSQKKGNQQSEYEGFVTYVKIFAHNQKVATSLPITGKTVDVLNNKTLKKLFARKRVKQHLRKHRVISKSEVAQKLKALNLMTNGSVLKGTFLCLAEVEQIRSVSENAHIAKFFSYEDNEGLRTSITEFVQGNLIEQFEQMLQHIKNNLYLVRDVETRTEDYQIPEQVFTELLANAFIHRSYDADNQTNIKVELYPDRLCIFNPGKFPDALDLTKTAEIENSYIINPEIVQIFYLNEWVETAARGIKRSQAILKSRRMKPALFEQKKEYVKVTIFKDKPSDTQQALQTAYQLLDKEDFVGFFEWVDSFQSKSTTLDELRAEFISGNTSSGYIDRLRVFAQHIIQQSATNTQNE